ncbi:hypothetical protein N658DRAFT_104680 [Parathielavia hyrcaniae]|uniref:Uncharacterized protein n=1 Tax=Parathielavia hyrcaniae TaxID=113614 RepID=A0AAN6Q0V3_9PEZI|nr:hypothetical protein N658DRAFT_104680 [Parathielavia hyrcaniae]
MWSIPPVAGVAGDFFFGILGLVLYWFFFFFLAGLLLEVVPVLSWRLFKHGILRS